MATSATLHLFWITSRAAGIVALAAASLTVSLGLLMSTKLLRRRGPDLLATHEILSLSALAAIAVHGVALLGDGFLHPSIADISVPFVGSYKTVWTTLGIVAGWGLTLLGLSYYARRLIGSARWRALHRLTALVWLAGLVHALGEGTDAGQQWFLAMVAVVVLPALALLAVRLLGGRGRAPVSRGLTRGDGRMVPAPAGPALPGDGRAVPAPGVPTRRTPATRY